MTVAVFSLGATSLWAQTGKVEGTVLDPAGQPVAGAQVAILGTSFNAVTSNSGYYFMNNVPAGTYTLRSTYIGYQPSEVTGVVVLAGQTMTVNFNLQGAVKLGQITITAQNTPIVPRDQVTSKPIVSGKTINELPVNDVRQVLNLQPGVIESNSGRGLSIRGGRPGEAAVYVDGVLVRSENTGTSNIDLGTNSLEEASVTTGAIGAEFGNAQSGVINYVTKAGGSRFSGNFRYLTDAPFGSASFGDQTYQASLGGPILGNLTFYVSGTLTGNKQSANNWGADSVPSFVQAGIDTTVTVANEYGNPLSDSTTVNVPLFAQYGGTCSAANNDGYACQGRLRPWGFGTSLNIQGKLQYTYGSGSRMSLTYLNNTNQNRGNNVFNPESIGGARGVQNIYILDWAQQVFRGAEHALSFEANLSYQTQRTTSGSLTRASELSSRSPAGGIDLSPLKFVTTFDHFSRDTGTGAVNSLNTQADWDQLIYNLRTNTGTRVPFLLRQDLRGSQPYRFNPWGMATNFATSGNVGTGAGLYYEQRLYGRLTADWQLDRYNRFKFGGEYQWSRIDNFGGFATNGTGINNASTTTQIFNAIYSDSPIQSALYGEDRLDLGDVVLVVGLRWDRFDTRAYYPNTPGRTFTLPGFDPANPLAHFHQAAAHTALSPHVQVSFPVTDRTDFRLSYAHSVQSPYMQMALAGHNNDISITNSNDAFGGDVGYAKTIDFEFGIRHAFSQDMVLDLSAYNRDNIANFTYRIQQFYDSATGGVINLNVLQNADFGNTRGIDFSLIRRIGNWFNGQLSYTYSVAKNTGSDPFTYLNGLSRAISQVTGDRVPPAQAILPTNDNRTHNFAGSLAFNFPSGFHADKWWGKLLENGGIFATFRFASGLPYTQCRNSGTGTTGPGNGVCTTGYELGPINAARMPWVKYFDIRLQRGLKVGPTDWTVFADIQNLFNFKNIGSIFSETNDVVNQQFEVQHYVQPAINQLNSEAPSAVLINVPSGDSTISAIDLRVSCAQSAGVWTSSTQSVDCTMLRQVEARYGNGDGIFDANEQFAAFDASYRNNQGAWTRLGAGRQIRAGVEINF
ncbi:MAG TPA: TonB-dependent receptor [Gemmatimonadales bacterium]|nr:TonB-dependent receptor [Gemmatimonadales bacterium]